MTIQYPTKFSSSIHRLEHLLGVHYLIVPKSITDNLNLIQSRRFICTINETISWQCGLVSLSQGDYYITISKQRLDESKLKVGDEINVELTKDPSEYGMEVPEELFELLQQDDEGRRRFGILTPGRQRYIIGYVAGVKNPTKRLDRALLLIGNLVKLPEGSEQFRDLLSKPPKEH